MQDLPEKAMLLDALAQFLDKQLRPKLEDPALAFRVRIATHLSQLVAREIRAEDQHDLAEIARLREVLGRAEEAPPLPRALRHQAILEMKRALSKTVRDADLDEPAQARLRSAIKATLIEKLSVSQPRFDTSTQIE